MKEERNGWMDGWMVDGGMDGWIKEGIMNSNEWFDE
jgi:hypothetical protein